MKAYVFGDNKVVSVADNPANARINALERLRNHPSLAKMVAEEDPIEVSENKTRILYTSWTESKQ